MMKTVFLTLLFLLAAAFMPAGTTAKDVNIYDTFRLWYAYEKQNIEDLKAIDTEAEKKIDPALKRDKAGKSDPLQFDIFSADNNYAYFQLSGSVLELRPTLATATAGIILFCWKMEEASCL